MIYLVACECISSVTSIVNSMYMYITFNNKEPFNIMTIRKFSETEINTAWDARKKRSLRKLYSRNEYTRLLRLFKKRGWKTETLDRTLYLKRWRHEHPDKIKKWTKIYQERKRGERKDERLKRLLLSASAEQLQTALNNK